MTAADAQPLRLGFAGTGWIGRHRLAAALETGMVGAVWLCDPDAEALAAARQLVPEAVTVPQFGDLLDAGVDGIVIATPSAAHAPQALAALERGLPVYCQKPLARDATEAAAVLAAARQRDLRLGIDLCYRGVAGVEPIRQAFAAGALGQVFAAEARFHNAYGPGKPWFYDRALSGGGCFMDLGIHLLDLLLWLLQDPTVTGVHSRLFCGGERLTTPPSLAEDYAEVVLDLEQGRSVARIATSWRLPAGVDAVIELALYGTRGGAVLRNVGGSFYDFEVARTDGTSRQLLATPPDDWGGRGIAAWIRAVAAGLGFDNAVESYLPVARVIDEVYGR